MIDHSEVMRKGSFKLINSSPKRYACNKGELTLTSKNLSINCEGSWSETFPIEELDLEAHERKLEIRFGYYRTRFLKLIVDDPESWVECFKEVASEYFTQEVLRIHQVRIERTEELEKLLDMKPKALSRLYYDISKEWKPFETKSIRFIFDMYEMSRGISSRKLRAFIIAHCYLAFYERTKRLLYKIYKAKFGKGPKDDKELMSFLDDYPSWKSLLDTSRWRIKPNQIRNCVSHGEFYYDYKHSEFVFMVKKEKRIPLRELQRIVLPMLHLYSSVARSIVKKALTNGKT